MNHPITIWVGVIITLTVSSYLIKDNIFYRLVQKLALGTSTVILIVVTWQQTLKPYWWTPIRGALSGNEPSTGALWLLVLIPGLLWYCQMSKKWFWLSAPIIGLFVGVAAGMAFKSQVNLMIPQLGAALRPLNPWAGAAGFTRATAIASLNNLVFMLALFTTLFYFCFTIKATNRIFRVPMKTGRLAIMVALGAMFGNTVMTRMSFLIERMQFLADFLLKPLFRQIGL
jgi:hypothetical protein